MKTTIEVSARHIHLSNGDFRKLFGREEMSKRNELSQKGEFASNETVEVVGPKNRQLGIRVLGPFREESQLELSKTDCINLGVDAPYLESGTGKGAKVKVLGPRGELFDDIAIVAMRHIHLSTDNAGCVNLKDGDFISFEVGGERSVKLNNVVVRVADNFVNHVHIDTDDANASGISSGQQVEILTGGSEVK
jgi:propanediol utilization protein